MAIVVLIIFYRPSLLFFLKGVLAFFLLLTQAVFRHRYLFLPVAGETDIDFQWKGSAYS